ncbi:MAG: PKD domain-containing protein [Bacteroidales bacterium]|jgi:PKD repeat protein|nr:PKD domain-containing protein [Bacteroidales bacterium]
MKNFSKFSYVWCFLILFSCGKQDKENVPAPVAGFTCERNEENLLEIHFTNTSQNAVSYSWDFGDNSAYSTEKDPVHTYLYGGRYQVTLIAKNSEGVSDIKTQQVEVTQPIDPSADIPVTVRMSDHNAAQLTVIPTADGWEMEMNGNDPYFWLDAARDIDFSTHYILSFEAKVMADNLPGRPSFIVFLQAPVYPDYCIDHDLGYQVASSEWTRISVDLTGARETPDPFNTFRCKFGKSEADAVRKIAIRNIVVRTPSEAEKAVVTASIRGEGNERCTVVPDESGGWNIATDADVDPYFFIDAASPVLFGANHVLAFESKNTEEADLCMYIGGFAGGFYLSEQNAGFKIPASTEWVNNVFDLSSALFYGPPAPWTWMRIRIGIDDRARNISIRNIKIQH